MSTIRFGDGFELDGLAWELRREGRSVRLERIPMEILVLLIERRPELVTREQIAERVWGPGVFVDLDNSINVAIRKIRTALRDDSENPRCVRTVTGKGYRFIAPVSVEESATPDGRIAPSGPAVPALPATTAEPPPSEPAHPRPILPSPAAPHPSARPGVSRAVRWLALATLLLMAAVGWSAFRRSTFSAPRTKSERRRMLAVLPFENLTGDPNQEYFSDGFTEEMITRLSVLAPRRLGVIARTSVMHYKDDRVPLERIARELGVEYVLEGSIRRDEERVRITAQLIQVEDQLHVWAEQFDRDLTGILQMQEEIALAIAGEIDLALGDDLSGRRPHALSPEGVEAYGHYLRGRYFWNMRTPKGFQRAIEEFEKALAADPDDARVHAGLADTWALMGTWRVAPPDTMFPKAKKAALRAVQLDPASAAGHTSLALIHEQSEFDWRAAGEEFRRAIALDRNYATAHHWYGEYLGFQGRFDEALAEIDLARRLDPKSPIIAVDRAVILYYARRYDESIEAFHAVQSVDPRFGRVVMIVFPLTVQGRFDEAMEVIQAWQAREESPWSWAYLAFVEGRLGHLDRAWRALDEAERSNDLWNQDRWHLRIVALTGMGLKEEAMASLQEACRVRSTSLLTLKVDPTLDSLRDDQRFVDLLRCANLAP